MTFHIVLSHRCRIVATRQQPSTAKGAVFVTLEDETGVVKVIVWKAERDKQRAELLVRPECGQLPLLKAGKAVVVPPRSTRTEPRDHNRHLYKARHLIETFFAKLKQDRCIATRYDKTARNFLAPFIWQPRPCGSIDDRP
ncbi:MAG: hypothetical protein OEM00_02665 [Burkholderiaceae bacterium]|nr:hypothetical protein [Burkholderiaceae bacterium]